MTFPSLPSQLNDSCHVTCLCTASLSLGCLEHIHAAHTSVPAPNAGKTNILWVFLPPSPVLTNIKKLPGWGTMVTCHSQLVVAKVGFWCRTLAPSHYNRTEQSLISSLKNPPPIYFVPWPHYPAKIVLSSKMAVNHEDSVYCSLSLDTKLEDVSFLWVTFYFFLPVVLQRLVLCWVFYTWY